MEKLLKALEEKGVIKNLQDTANIMSLPKDWSEEEKKSCLDECVGDALMDRFKRDEELRDLFTDFCIEHGKRELVEKLNIRPDPNYQKTPDDVLKLLLVGLSGILDN